MITIEQCRAARGLLGWTQQELSEACGLSKTAINNFEKKHSDIKTESLRAIRDAFITAGVEFLDNHGLRMRAESMRIFRGSDMFLKLFSDILDTLKHKQQKSFICFMTQAVLNDTSYGITPLLKQLDFNKIQKQVLLDASDIELPEDFRTPSLNAFTDFDALFTYGSKYAFKPQDQDIIVLIDCIDICTCERERMRSIWEKACTEIRRTNSRLRA